MATIATYFSFEKEKNERSIEEEMTLVYIFVCFRSPKQQSVHQPFISPSKILSASSLLGFSALTQLQSFGRNKNDNLQPCLGIVRILCIPKKLRGTRRFSLVRTQRGWLGGAQSVAFYVCRFLKSHWIFRQHFKTSILPSCRF